MKLIKIIFELGTLCGWACIGVFLLYYTMYWMINEYIASDALHINATTYSLNVYMYVKRNMLEILEY